MEQPAKRIHRIFPCKPASPHYFFDYGIDYVSAGCITIDVRPDLWHIQEHIRVIHRYKECRDFINVSGCVASARRGPGNSGNIVTAGSFHAAVIQNQVKPLRHALYAVPNWKQIFSGSIVDGHFKPFSLQQPGQILRLIADGIVVTALVAQDMEQDPSLRFGGCRWSSSFGW